MPIRSTSFSLLLSLAAGCMQSPLPARFPSSSAASTDASAAPSAAVHVALDSDPPLPGEPLGEWFGLAPRPSAAAATSHGDHHAH